MGNSNSNKLKKDYFELVKKSMKAAYIENSGSVLNQMISLQKKNFNTILTNQRLIMPENKNDLGLDWQDYLIQALQRKPLEDYSWTQGLFNLLYEKEFPNQIKFQSNFFHQEFKIMTCPKFIKEDKSDLKENATSINGIDYSIVNNKLNISSNLMGSICSVQSDSSGVINDTAAECKLYKSKINEYIVIFKEHLFNLDHPINTIIRLFNQEFCKRLDSVLDKSYDELNQISEGIIQELCDFIVEMQVVVKLFYSTSISYQFFKQEKDEFLNLISSLVFNFGETYSKMYQLFNKVNEKKIEIFKTKLDMLKGMKPEDLGVKKKFCLNKQTTEFQNELMKESMTRTFNIPENEEEKIEKKKDSPLPGSINSVAKSPTKANQKDLVVSSESLKLMQFTHLNDENEGRAFNEGKEPYVEAIELLQSLSSYRAPLEKLIVIASVSAQITVCVNEFWKKCEKIITPSLLSIDADELMSIFIYIILRANNPELFTHVSFIRHFTTPGTKSTMMGYYFTTLDGSLNFINEINSIDELNKK